MGASCALITTGTSSRLFTCVFPLLHGDCPCLDLQSAHLRMGDRRAATCMAALCRGTGGYAPQGTAGTASAIPMTPGCARPSNGWSARRKIWCRTGARCKPLLRPPRQLPNPPPTLPPGRQRPIPLHLRPRCRPRCQPRCRRSFRQARRRPRRRACRAQHRLRPRRTRHRLRPLWR